MATAAKCARIDDRRANEAAAVASTAGAPTGTPSAVPAPSAVAASAGVAVPPTAGANANNNRAATAMVLFPRLAQFARHDMLRVFRPVCRRWRDAVASWWRAHEAEARRKLCNQMGYDAARVNRAAEDPQTAVCEVLGGGGRDLKAGKMRLLMQLVPRVCFEIDLKCVRVCVI